MGGNVVWICLFGVVLIVALALILGHAGEFCVAQHVENWIIVMQGFFGNAEYPAK